MSKASDNNALTPPPPFLGDATSPTTPTSFYDTSSSDSLPSSPQRSSISTTISSLFPGLQIADHFMPDDFDDDYGDDFVIHGNDVDTSSQESSSLLPCNLFNQTSATSQCQQSMDLTKTKIYSPEDLWAENEIFARKLAPAMAFIALLMIIGILGNALVVYVYGFRFKSATQHFLIVCLACFDLVMCIVAMPAEIADIRFHHTFTSVFACKLLRFVTMFASISSSFTLVTVAFDRHRRITKPLSKQMSMKQARIWMLSNMAAAFCFSWPMLVLTGIRSSETRIPGLAGTDCSFSEKYKTTKYPLIYNAVLGLGFFTSITVIAVFYFRIWKTAKSRKINMAKRYTIGSLSDQFMSELKLQRQISKDGMTEVLSKQLEKCVRGKLQTTPSIDCKDIYYFFETNSIRSTICSSVAKKRGRYKGFSMSSFDYRSKDTDGSCVLGHSFSYRPSVNVRPRNQGAAEEEEFEIEGEIKEVDVSRNLRYVGRKNSKLSKSFSMAKIPEHSPSCYKMDKLQIHRAKSCKVKTVPLEAEETSFQICDSDKDNFTSNTNVGELQGKSRIEQDTFSGGDPLKKSYQSKKQQKQPRSKVPCQSSRSNSPFLQISDNEDTTSTVVSPSLSLKSTGSSISSPGRYRRNSSPQLGQDRRRVKAKVENSISIISDEFRPRPMSSLVDSVSQTLDRMHQFSNFGTHADMTSPDFFCNELKPNNIIHKNINENIMEDEEEITNTCLGIPNGNVIQTNVILNNHSCNDGGRLESKNSDGINIESESGQIVNERDIIVGDTCTCSDEIHTEACLVGKSLSLDLLQSCDKDNDIVMVHNSVDEMLSCESWSHLIGPRCKPIEIPHSPDEDDSSTKPNEIADTQDDYRLTESNGNASIDNLLHNESVCVSVDKTSCNGDCSSKENFTEPDKTDSRIAGNNLISSTNDSTQTSKDSAVTHPSSPNSNEISVHEPHLTNGVITTGATPTPAICDTSDVETRHKPRSFSNTSLDYDNPSAIPRRRNKSRCVCLSQNLDKTTVVAFTVSSVFILSFLPFLILMFIRGLVKDFDYSLDGTTLCVYHIFLRFYFLNSAINPILYGLLNVNFRYECMNTWRKFATCLGEAQNKTRHKQPPAVC